MESKEEAERETEAKIMKPWEQHAGVISIPRFDYNAPSALLRRSLSGFLITCSIKREKSATKEAMSILEKYLGSCSSGSFQSLESSNENNAKRRKILADETGGINFGCVESNTASENSKDDCLSISKTDIASESGFIPSLVKLTGSGLLLLTFIGENSPNTVDIVSDIFQRLESGSLKRPLWCHRILPIQGTCPLNEKELRTVVSKLVIQFMNDKRNKLADPIKIAVAYNRRGIEDSQMKIVKNTSEDFDVSLLNRSKCFDVVASAVKDAVKEAPSDVIVDLKSPDLSILVELLPLSGVPDGSLVAALSIVPPNLVSVKPRLCIRPLVSDANGKNERS